MIMKNPLKYTVFLFLFLSLFSGLIWATEDNKVALLSSASQPSDHIGQITLSLVAILVVIFFAAWMLKRFSAFPGIASGHLRVLGAISLGQREKVVLLQVGKEQIVVGVTSSEISLLHKLEEEVEVAEMKPVMSGAFANRLQEALSRNKSVVSKKTETPESGNN